MCNLLLHNIVKIFMVMVKSYEIDELVSKHSMHACALTSGKQHCRIPSPAIKFFSMAEMGGKEILNAALCTQHILHV